MEVDIRLASQACLGLLATPKRQPITRAPLPKRRLCLRRCRQLRGYLVCTMRCTLRPVVCPPAWLEGQPRVQNPFEVSSLPEGLNGDKSRRLPSRHASEALPESAVRASTLHYPHYSLENVFLCADRDTSHPAPPLLPQCEIRRFFKKRTIIRRQGVPFLWYYHGLHGVGHDVDAV